MSNDEQARMTKRLQAHVQLLAGDIGERNVLHPAALNDAVSYIESEWNRQGYAVKQLAYEVSGVRCANLEVVRDGNTRWREILLVGAHYDSVMGSPGANDNASGVAALLETSRKVAAIDPSMTVRFVAFVNEEPPFFMSNQQGSMVYAKSARHRGDDIRLMASLETIGWYSNRPGSQRYPPLFNLFYPGCEFYRYGVRFPFRGGDAATGARLQSTLRFPVADSIDLSIRPRRLLERSPVVLAAGLPRNDDHGHRALSLSALSCPR